MRASSFLVSRRRDVPQEGSATWRYSACRFSKAACHSLASRCASASCAGVIAFAVASLVSAYSFCSPPVTRNERLDSCPGKSKPVGIELGERS